MIIGLLLLCIWLRFAGNASAVRVDCGNPITMEGGCLFNLREDPHETKDLVRPPEPVLANPFSGSVESAFHRPEPVLATF